MKLKSILIGLAILGGVMAVTNPSKESYIEYASDTLSETGKELICSLDLPIPNYKQTCEFTVPMGKPIVRKLIEPMVSSLTRRPQNFVLFTIFVTEFPNRKITTIGAFNNFYMLK
jgi:hypothetical protein